MNPQHAVEAARKHMHQAEDSLKYYALSGGKDLAEYARLLDLVKMAREEFFEVMGGGRPHFDSQGGTALHRPA
jgi:hypothetical protein